MKFRRVFLVLSFIIVVLLVFLTPLVLGVWFYRAEHTVRRLQTADGRLTAIVTTQRQSWIPEGLTVRLYVYGHDGRQFLCKNIHTVDIFYDAQEIAKNMKWEKDQLILSGNIQFERDKR